MFKPGAAIVAAVALFGLAASQKITLQAEDAVLSGTTKGSSVAGFTGKSEVLSTKLFEVSFISNSNTDVKSPRNRIRRRLLRRY